MLEINRRYILDAADEPIAVQIPMVSDRSRSVSVGEPEVIGQFESLLGMMTPEQQVIVREDGNLGWSDDELRQAAVAGLTALEQGEYDDYDEAGLDNLFDRIKQRV
jgi:hypothetical protein